MGLRGLQERQSHGQLSSAFLEGLDKLSCAEHPPCRLRRNDEIPWMQTGATDEPAVHLFGKSSVGKAAPLLNVRQGWRVIREKGQRRFGAGKRRQQCGVEEYEITETVTFPGMNRTERSGRLNGCFSSSPGSRSSLQFADHFLVFG